MRIEVHDGGHSGSDDRLIAWNEFNIVSRVLARLHAVWKQHTYATRTPTYIHTRARGRARSRTHKHLHDMSATRFLQEEWLYLSGVAKGDERAVKSQERQRATNQDPLHSRCF